jgi:hypothetical protein
MMANLLAEMNAMLEEIDSNQEEMRTNQKGQKKGKLPITRRLRSFEIKCGLVKKRRGPCWRPV